MKDEADKHRAVCAAADDLQAVIAELNASHPRPSAPSACTPAHSNRQTKSMSGMTRAGCTDLLATCDVPDSHGVIPSIIS